MPPIRLSRSPFGAHPTSLMAMVAAGCLALGIAASGQTKPAAPSKTFIDYFKPMPIVGKLTSDIWGVPAVWPRDPKNGLEDETLKQWTYWDGQIVKGEDGKFHLYGSRWDQARGHNGWFGSLAVHAVADKVMGPYVDKGLMWPDSEGGKGHNVTALKMHDGRYAAVISETRPGEVFVAKSANGPFEHLGTIHMEPGSPQVRFSNLSIMLRPDGDYMIVPRSGAVWISKGGILGPYKVVVPRVYDTVAGLPLRNLEDPVVWYSGGLYHIVVNGWFDRKAYHMTSKDGISNWVFRGLAYDPRTAFLRYTDGTVNKWDKLERPGVLIENGHITHITLSTLDVEKAEERGNDTHGSKIIVIPFDGAALDRDLRGGAAPPAPPAPGSAAYDALHPGEPPTVPPPPAPRAGGAGRRGGGPGTPAAPGAPATPPAQAVPAAPSAPAQIQ